jgi:hypothetical protein
MLGHGTSLRIELYGLAAAAVLGVALLPGAVRAGTLTELALHKGNLSAHPPMELCVGVSRSANCRSTIETALRAATSVGTPRGALYEALGSANPSHQMTSVSSAGEDRELGARSLALKFNEDPEWKRRATVIARDGLPFMRLPQSGNRELLVGITPHGLLGFSLRDKTD